MGRRGGQKTEGREGRRDDFVWSHKKCNRVDNFLYSMYLLYNFSSINVLVLVVKKI